MLSPSERHKGLRDRLLSFGETIPKEELTPTLVPEAAHLIAENQFAFALAVCLDRGIRAEVAWSIPYWLNQQLGHLDPRQISNLSVREIARVLSRLPLKPRYMRDAPRTVKELAEIVAGECDGDAERIWLGRTAADVQRTLLQIHGIGDGIAAMAVGLLERCRGVRFPDPSSMHVKPDTHVQRVLYRLGAAQKLEEREALRAAASLNPGHPGALDPALWVIGRRWCHLAEPDCGECVMSDLCPRTGV